MKGDTIVARFTQADSAGRSRALLSQIEARDSAQSYHLEPNLRFPARPSVNYARGDADRGDDEERQHPGGGSGGHPGPGGRDPARGDLRHDGPGPSRTPPAV